MDTLTELVQALDGRPGSLQAADGRLSLGELGQSARRQAAALAPLRRRRALLVAEPSLAFVRELLACWAAGVLPLVVDAWTGGQLMSAQTPGAVAPALGHRAAAIWHQGQWQATDAAATADSPEAALVLFTSGSAGRPKGVVLGHRGLFAQLNALAVGMQLAEPARVGILLPLHHSFALITQLLLSLWTGGDIHLLPAASLPGEKLTYLQQHRIQRLAGVPTHFRLLLDDDGLTLPALRQLKVAGAALDQALAGRILQACPQAELWVGYGLTEAGPRVSALPHHDSCFAGGSVGKALPGVNLRLTAGELEVASPSQMLGYLDQPANAGEWLSTGDTARIEAGYLYILGRRDELFQVAGEKIAPLEIERVLLSAPGVRVAAVYGEPDALLGHRLVALIAGDTDLTALRRFVRRQLPPEKRPQSWYAVNDLPLTSNGKLRRKDLPQWPKTPFTSAL